MQDFEAEALGILAKASQGYPYFIQELGSAMWRLAKPFLSQRSISGPLSLVVAGAKLIVPFEASDPPFPSSSLPPYPSRHTV